MKSNQMKSLEFPANPMGFQNPMFLGFQMNARISNLDNLANQTLD